MRAHLIAAVALLLAAGSPIAQASDADAGRDFFKRTCAPCHRLEPNRNAVGPSLYGVVGRKAGSAPAFAYSQALRSADFIWTPELLDRWLQNPKAFVSGTKMPFAGVPKVSDRANVIEFLRETSK